MKYRKKPVVIEAFQYDGDLIDTVGNFYVPDWAKKAYEEDTIYFNMGDLFIETLQGITEVKVGDYVIQGVKGELYSCKPDIFEQTHEVVEG